MLQRRRDEIPIDQDVVGWSHAKRPGEELQCFPRLLRTAVPHGLVVVGWFVYMLGVLHGIMVRDESAMIIIQ